MATNLYQRCGSSLLGTEKEKKAELNRLEQSGQYFAQSKCDGIWSVCIGHGDHNTILSRNGKEKPYNLPSLPKGMTIAGELGYGSEESTKRFEEIGHEFMDVYDILEYKGMSVKHYSDWDRFMLLSEFVKKLSKKDQEYFRLVNCYLSDFSTHYDNEHEGLVLKPISKNTEYIPGTTNVKWIKVKHEYDFDMVVMNYEISTAETKVKVPMAKCLVVGQYVNGKLKEMTKVGSLPIKLCAELVKDFARYKGLVITVHGYKRFESGAVRHPSFKGFRDDKDAKDCVFNPMEC